MTLGVLGRSLRLYPLQLHAFVFLSNHYHLLLSVDDALQLARFINYLNSNLAREAGRLSDWKEKFWGRRYQAIVISEEEPAQVDRMRYVLSHGCKEGLVERPRNWPGAQCVEALVSGQQLEGLWFDRTQEYAARVRGGEVHPLEHAKPEAISLDPLPCWRDLSRSAYRGAIREICVKIEADTSARHSREGTRPLGLKAILALHPHDRPAKLKNSWAPAFHAATKAARRELVAAYSWFQQAYRVAAESMRREDARTGFPEGSFPPRKPFVSWEPKLAPG